MLISPNRVLIMTHSCLSFIHRIFIKTINHKEKPIYEQERINHGSTIKSERKNIDDTSF